MRSSGRAGRAPGLVPLRGARTCSMQSARRERTKTKTALMIAGSAATGAGVGGALKGLRRGAYRRRGRRRSGKHLRSGETPLTPRRHSRNQTRHAVFGSVFLVTLTRSRFLPRNKRQRVSVTENDGATQTLSVLDFLCDGPAIQHVSAPRVSIRIVRSGVQVTHAANRSTRLVRLMATASRAGAA